MTTQSLQGRRILIFGIHNTVDWWRHLGLNMGWESSTVVTDLRGEGDISVVDDFYAEMQRLQRRPDPLFSLLTADEKRNVIARCRTLRWLEPELAHTMVEAMAYALDRVLDRIAPRLVLSFPIDRYVKHVLKLLAARRGVPYLELTASVVPELSMLLRDGRLASPLGEAAAYEIERQIATITSPTFTPSYVPKKATYTRGKFVRTLGYYRARALALKLKSLRQVDPLNIHFLDAQPTLGHKCRWRDIRIVGLSDPQWRAKVEAVPQAQRVLFGLQLFPEASIDYWIANPALLDHENLVVRAAKAFSDAGFVLMVKDHPLQFGFRQTEFIDRLRALKGAVIVPYEVSGNELMSLAGVNFTFTGTMGFQAALQGIKSVVTDSYYSNDEDFIVFRSPEELDLLPQRVLNFDPATQVLVQRQRRIIGQLLQGSFAGDFYSFKSFSHVKPTAGADTMALALGNQLDLLAAQGQI